ncbi:YjeF-related protein N-terminus-domain-containing protein [Podospora appendiculata]|uniref:Enhancer of mRNA-decapping protein 3 n=1 Tax=Podospora appendiculata TaxID=314037 RepID=A0AAE1CF26_9PEZI|nr:YjeF-related protein N-terminus-domain-containing protein [Podospora appendiculata]
MAEQFIGLQMLVTLRNPPGKQLRGNVSAVEAGAVLTLSNVWALDTNQWEPRVTIAASNIEDLIEVRSDTSPHPSNQFAPTQAPQSTPPAAAAVAVAPHVTQAPPKPAFVDPAIVAMGKRPEPLPTRSPETRYPPQPSGNRDLDSVVIPPARAAAQATASREITPTTAVASEPVKGLQTEAPATIPESADDEVAPNVVPQPAQVSGQKRKNKNWRQRKTGNSKTGAQEDPDVSPQVSGAAGSGKGWRQTPMLQSTSSFQPFNSLKKNASKGRPSQENGWASEDVTDVQEMGDFDFEGGLAKFDKTNLFEQMRKDDRVDDADRLVSHNRQPRPKPGTAGGKNFHHSENVLEVPAILKAPARPVKDKTNEIWNSEADDGALNGNERLSGRELGSRQGSRRGESKVSATRRSQSRKASGVNSAQTLSRVNSGVSHLRTHSAKGSRPSSRLSSNVTVVDKKKQQQQQQQQQHSHHSVSAATAQGFYVLPSNRRIETVSALQMLNLENIAHSEVGLTEEMMTENAGRGIAEVSLMALSDPAIQVRYAGTIKPSASTPPPPPTVVVLAGNNKSGIRAVAGARHLRNKGINVLVCVVGLERGERGLLEDMRAQVRLYKNLGGRVFSKSDFFEHLRKVSIPMMTIDTPRTSSLASLTNPAPVMLIIDALLGLAMSFEELRSSDEATVYELIEWANRNEAFVLAIDVPTGIHPTSGVVSVIDGNRLYCKPRYVVAVGAPKRGLLEAMMAAENEDGETIVGVSGMAEAAVDDAVLEWRLFLVDLGFAPAVWKKAGTKIRKGIDFDTRWVVEMKYLGIEQGEESDENEEEV